MGNEVTKKDIDAINKRLDAIDKRMDGLMKIMVVESLVQSIVDKAVLKDKNTIKSHGDSITGLTDYVYKDVKTEIKSIVDALHSQASSIKNLQSELKNLKS